MDEFARATNKPNQGDAVTSTETPAAPAKKQAGTKYIVLRRMRAATYPEPNTTSSGSRAEQWEVVGSTDATSAQDAVRNLAEKALNSPPLTNAPRTKDTLIAVPTRSWAPVNVSVVSRVTLEDA